MTRAKRLKPLRQIHFDSTCALGLHLHHFYHFDTPTDLYLRYEKKKVYKPIKLKKKNKFNDKCRVIHAPAKENLKQNNKRDKEK